MTDLHRQSGTGDAAMTNARTPSQPGGEVRLSERERKALETLADAGGCEDFGYLSFKTIAGRSGLDLKVVRRTVRALARKGLAKYERGLWTEDGELAGSGYAATEAGLQLGQLAADRSQP